MKHCTGLGCTKQLFDIYIYYEVINTVNLVRITTFLKSLPYFGFYSIFFNWLFSNYFVHFYVFFLESPFLSNLLNVLSQDWILCFFLYTVFLRSITHIHGFYYQIYAKTPETCIFRPNLSPMSWIYSALHWPPLHSFFFLLVAYTRKMEVTIDISFPPRFYIQPWNAWVLPPYNFLILPSSFYFYYNSLV